MYKSCLSFIYEVVLAYLDLTLAHSIVLAQGHAHFIYISITNFSKMEAGRTNITIAIIHDVAHGLSIRIYRVDLGVF